jgi:pSer/pThr/pTyr-binding forkhead associated (FHA) protein
MGAVQVSPASETKWTVINGPMKGSVRLMNLSQFTIGRNSDCEFVISNDPKCSRKHALVSTDRQYSYIESLNDKNPVSVNGRDIERARLKDGDIITIGETQIQFNATSLPNLQPHPIYARVAPAPGIPRSNRPTGRSVKSGGAKRFLMYGGLALVGALIFLDSPKKKKELELRTEQQIQADIEAANKLKEISDQQAMKRLDGSLTAQQAQENYVRGFRDYKKGQYERALVSFQACLALNPEHILCNRYLRLAQRRFNELIQYQIVLGRKYRDQNQYKACRSAFRNVMVMIKDANNASYREAKANYEACNSLVEGRF